MRLASSLRCDLLLLTTDKCTMRHLYRLICSLGLVIQALGAFSFLDLCKSLVVIVAFEKLLDTGSIELGLVRDHGF